MHTGWVKQPSPCCAAAAVAGAWNALAGIERTHAKALHFPDVISIYCTILREQIERLSLSFERKLGAGPNVFLILHSAISEEFDRLSAEELDGETPPKKEKKVTRTAVGKAMRAAIKTYKASIPPPSPARNPNRPATEEPPERQDLDLAVIENIHPLLCMEEVLKLEAVEKKCKPDAEDVSSCNCTISVDIKY